MHALLPRVGRDALHLVEGCGNALWTLKEKLRRKQVPARTKWGLEAGANAR